MKINEKNLICYSTSRDHIDKEGYLLKKEEANKAFQRRWFVLKGNLLFYFDKKGDKEPIGVIILEGCAIELAESEDYHAFKLTFHGASTRQYVLAADSQETLETWMKFIARASYDYLKLIVAELEKQLEEIEVAEQEKGLAGAGVTSLVSICSQPTTYSNQRENPFNRPEDKCSYNDLWKSNEALQNATSLLSRTSSLNGSKIFGVNTSLPPSVPFRPAPPPPVFRNFPSAIQKKTFEQLHIEYGKLILEDKQKYNNINSNTRGNDVKIESFGTDDKDLISFNQSETLDVHNLIDL